jgi:hypothetical protein
MKINIILSPQGGIAKPHASSVADIAPKTVRTYYSNVSKKKMDALENLHRIREEKHSKQRALGKLKETKAMRERQAEEKQLTTEISALENLETAAEQVFQNTN